MAVPQVGQIGFLNICNNCRRGTLVESRFRLVKSTVMIRLNFAPIASHSTASFQSFVNCRRVIAAPGVRG